MIVEAHSQPIVVGSDGSPTAAFAVERAAQLARDRGAELHIVIAYSNLSAADRHQIESMPDELRWMGSAGQLAELTVANAARMARAVAPINVETHAVFGDPTTALIEVAQAVGASTIVVGNVGMQGVTAYVRGSVPNRLSHRAPCDVLIVDTSGRAA
jgi:nucleotide-binding universal stress UspA family protein